MDIQEVKTRVQDIKNFKGDYEAAHSKEDELHREVLKAISEGEENPEKLAEEALKTREIDFARYCA